MRMRSLTNGMAVWAAALAITAGACNTSDRDAATADMNDAPGTVGTSGEADGSSPVTVTGCLQQGDGGFILTQANEQPGPVATSGEKEGKEGQEVREKQQQAAARSYRLSGDDDNLRDLVGHQVRISGTVEDRGEVHEREGEQARDDEIERGGLAELEVRSAQSGATGARADAACCAAADAGTRSAARRSRRRARCMTGSPGQAGDGAAGGAAPR